MRPRRKDFWSGEKLQDKYLLSESNRSHVLIVNVIGVLDWL